jgi:beta-galactosidase
MLFPSFLRRIRTWLLLSALGLGTASASWEFHVGDTSLAAVGAVERSGWIPVVLPHDWSIAGTPEEAASSSGHGGFFPTGVGWYRCEFTPSEAWRGRTVELAFEGACGATEVWLNGVLVATQPSSYFPFRADLTPHLRWGAANVVAVRVDNSAQPNSRWYTGSGLIRPVAFATSGPVHFAPDGVWVRTESLRADHARLRVAAEGRAPASTAARLEVTHRFFSPEGKVVAEARADAVIATDGSWATTATVDLSHPQMWTPDEPHLYRLVSTLRGDGRELDERVTTCGIRTVHVSAERGFELNGRPLELNGGNVHHDHGPLGAAAFARAEERKVRLLKAAGFNAVRTAHNPPSRAFLAACDQFGLLVLNEVFDGWVKAKTKHDYSTLFRDHWERDLTAWVRRDRGHPSVVMWSVGNEMFERGNAEGRRIAHELADRVRDLDPSRPVTAGVNSLGTSGPWEQLDPLFAAFDVAGYNYELARHAADHARLPRRIMLAAESYQSEVFANWQIANRHAYVIGDFVWSALDYLGEAGIGRVFAPGETARKHWEGSQWPWHGASCGDLDLTGWRKPISHYRAIVWDRGETLHAAVVAPAPGGGEWNLTPWSLPPALPSWTWDVAPGTPLQLEIASRHERVRVVLNGRVMSEAPTGEAEQFRARVTVPFEPGELVVLGLAGGVERERFALRTAGVPAQLRVTPDHESLVADGQDLVFLTVEAVDAAGQWCPSAAPEVTVSVRGPAVLAGYGTGDVGTPTCYQAPTRRLHQGRALAIVRSTTETGDVMVRFTAPGYPPVEIPLTALLVTRR